MDTNVQRSKKWSISPVLSVSYAYICGAGGFLYQLRDDTSNLVRPFAVGGLSMGLSMYASSTVDGALGAWTSFETDKAWSLDDFSEAWTLIKSVGAGWGVGYGWSTIEWPGIRRTVSVYGRIRHLLLHSVPGAGMFSVSGDEVDVGGWTLGTGASVEVLAGLSFPLGPARREK